MEALSASETTNQSRTLGTQKIMNFSSSSSKLGLVATGNIKDFSFKKDLDRMRIRCPNSKNIALGNNIVPECVEATRSTDTVEYNSEGNMTSNYYNGQVINAANHLNALSESDSRCKFLEVTPNVPFPTDRDVVSGHEEDITEQYINQGEKAAPVKTKIIIRKRSSDVSRFTMKESCAYLEQTIKALKEENRRLRSKLQDEAEISLQLKNENTNLLDALRQKCPPDVIASLEAENPDPEIP